MNLYLVRHGESSGNAANIIQSDSEILTALGEKQAQLLAKRLSKIPLELIVASPLTRTKRTAEIIAANLSTPIEYSDLIVEKRVASAYIGKHVSEPEVKEMIQKVRASYDFPDQAHWDEETFGEFTKRINEFLEGMIGLGKENIAVVTHGNTMRMIIGQMMFKGKINGKEFRQIMEYFETINTGITWCTYFPEKGWRLMTWNDHAHLGELPK